MLKLVRRGMRARRPQTRDVLEGLRVSQIMTSRPETVPETLSIEELAQRFQASGHHGFPVLGADGGLSGIVTLSDLERAVTSDDPAATVADVMTRQLVTTFPDESVYDALAQFGARDVGRLPVVARDDPRHLVGVLRRSDIIGAYGRAVSAHRVTQTQAARLRATNPAGTRFIERGIEAGSSADTVAVRDLGLPPSAVLVSVVRDGQPIIPRGDMRLVAGDEALFLVTTHGDTEVDAILAGSPPGRHEEVGPGERARSGETTTCS